MTAELRNLWQEAFGDTDVLLDGFEKTGFSSDRHHCIMENGTPVSALYWFDCILEGQKLAYIYAVATLKSHRGKGLATRLMTETHEILKKQGYAGAILVPASGLFPFYEKIGYKTVSQIKRLDCQAQGEPAPLEEISVEEFARLRRRYLPAGGVIQEGVTLSYLATYAKLYKGEDFLLAATKEKDHLLVYELLGNKNICSNILCALACKTGRFRTPGVGQDFAMLLPFAADCPTPSYFGLALD